MFYFSIFSHLAQSPNQLFDSNNFPRPKLCKKKSLSLKACSSFRKLPRCHLDVNSVCGMPSYFTNNNTFLFRLGRVSSSK